MEHTHTETTHVTTTNYAGFWRRVLAYVLDSIIVGAVAMILIGTRHMMISPVPALAIGWLYFALMESSKYQATLGKMALSMKVTDESGKRISFGRATGRHFAKFLSTIIILIGYLMIVWNKKKQGLHDKLAHTLVVKTEASSL